MENKEKARHELITKFTTFVVQRMIEAVFCLIGWNIIAWQFNLPTFTYFQWIMIICFVKNLLH